MTSAIRLSLAALVLFSVWSAAQDLSSAGKTASVPTVTGSYLYVKVRLDSPLKVSKLKPGDRVSGKLLQDVYSGAAEVFPGLSVVHLSVDRLDRRRRRKSE
jgi:hypothetical protein